MVPTVKAIDELKNRFNITQALYKNRATLMLVSSCDCQGFAEGGEELDGFQICADLRSVGWASRIGFPTSVDGFIT